MMQARTIPSRPILAGWSVIVNEKANEMVTGAGSGRKVRQLRQSKELLQESLHQMCGKAAPENAKEATASDKKHYRTDIMLSCAGSPATVKTTSNHPVSPYPVLHILNGDLLPTSMADRFLQRVWERLSASEKSEPDVSLRDDLRIAKLCILELDKGNPDPWRSAFWQYMGITPEKWQGIYAEREAYKKTLGPTLAEQLQDPAFLASLEPLVRASLFAPDPQMRIPFSPESVSLSPRKKRVA